MTRRTNRLFALFAACLVMPFIVVWVSMRGSLHLWLGLDREWLWFLLTVTCIVIGMWIAWKIGEEP